MGFMIVCAARKQGIEIQKHWKHSGCHAFFVYLVGLENLQIRLFEKHEYFAGPNLI